MTMPNTPAMQNDSPADTSRTEPTGAISESLFEILWRGRWLVAAGVVLMLVIGFVYLLHATPLFESTSRIYVEQSGPRIIENMQGFMTQSTNYLYTQAELLSSTPIIARVAEQPEIRRMATFANVDNPVAFIRRNLDVSVGRQDDIISVSLESPYPSEAAQIVNAIIDSYMSYHGERQRGTSLEILKVLQTQKERTESDLQTTRQTLLDYQREHPSLTFETRQGNIILERLARLSEALTAAELSTVEARSAYESIKQNMADPARLRSYLTAQRTRTAGMSRTDSEAARVTAQILELSIQIENLQNTQQLTDDHPSIAGLKRRTEILRSELDTMDTQFAEAILAIARQDYLAAQENETQIRDYFEKQRDEALTLSEISTQYAILNSDIGRLERLSDILDDRIKEISVADDVGVLNINILEVARPADIPSKPQRARIMAMALMLGLMLGSGGALARDWMDHRLRSSDEIAAVLGIPVLGTVPSMSKRKSIADRGLVVQNEGTALVSEAYRTIRTAVFFGMPDGRAKSILITSPGPGDGKTTLASNLAITMAQAGQKTLLIDADFRKPMLHNIFTLDIEKGLTALLAGQVDAGAARQNSQIPNLTVITAGPEVPNPSEILNSEAFAQRLEQYKADFDRIVIDSPPVMPVTDARIIAAQCDVTLLVLRAMQSTRKASQQARDGLLSVGAALLGTVVNDVAKKDSRYGYYAGYGAYRAGHYGQTGKRSKLPS